MGKSVDPFRKKKYTPPDILFKLKMTQEMRLEAERLFRLGIQSCKDVASSIGVSESTIRKYYPLECSEANARFRERELRKKDIQN